MRLGFCALAIATAVGCASSPPAEPDPFTTLESRIGETVTVRGFLQYEFEDHNLFAEWSKEGDHAIGALCIPIEASGALKARLTALHEQEVVIQGEVARFYDPAKGELNSYYCKEVGLYVRAIRPG
jgi:hypothetical protein